MPGGFKKKIAKLGDIIIVSVQTLRNRSTKISKVKKKEVCKGLIIRTKTYNGKTTGLTLKFDQNAVILLNDKGNPIGTRIIGPVSNMLSEKALHRISNMSAFVLKV